MIEAQTTAPLPTPTRAEECIATALCYEPLGHRASCPRRHAPSRAKGTPHDTGLWIPPHFALSTASARRRKLSTSHSPG